MNQWRFWMLLWVGNRNRPPSLSTFAATLAPYLSRHRINLSPEPGLNIDGAEPNSIFGTLNVLQASAEKTNIRILSYVHHASTVLGATVHLHHSDEPDGVLIDDKKLESMTGGGGLDDGDSLARTAAGDTKSATGNATKPKNNNNIESSLAADSLMTMAIRVGRNGAESQYDSW